MTNLPPSGPRAKIIPLRRGREAPLRTPLPSLPMRFQILASCPAPTEEPSPAARANALAWLQKTYTTASLTLGSRLSINAEVDADTAAQAAQKAYQALVGTMRLMRGESRTGWLDDPGGVEGPVDLQARQLRAFGGLVDRHGVPQREGKKGKT